MADETVLLVDDELDFVEALAERLEARGIHADSAGSGEEALIKAAGRRYDMVVLDLAMPGMDGLETMRRLMEINPDAQVLLLTGQGNIKTAVEAVKIGARDYLQKPASIDTLLEKLKEAHKERLRLEKKEAVEHIADIIQRRGW